MNWHAKTFLLGIICFTAFTNAHASEPANEPIRIKVLSYNIHHGEGVDGKLDLERIAKVILSAEPDLVAVQEVDRNVRRTTNVDQPAELAKLTKFHVAFGANIELQGGHYGNAILSRHPIQRHENHLLPNVDSGEQRGVIAAEISIQNSASSLLFLATHFDFRHGQNSRISSVKAINEIANKQRLPAILAGDLNDVIGSETLNLLSQSWVLTNKAPLPTSPSTKPTKQIDFILVQPAHRWKIVETRVLEEAIASDHRAILSVLELLPE